MYYCPKCRQIFCENCEITQDLHPDPYYKIRNIKQFDKLKKDYSSYKVLGVVKDKVGEIFKDVVGFVGNKFHNGNNNNEQNEETNYQQILQNIRRDIDLTGVSDDKILNALMQSNGNIDLALPLLFPQ